MTAAQATRSVLVAGEANVDLVLRGDVLPRFGQQEQLLEQAELTLGSSAIIVACGLARLGVAVRLAAVLGDDDLGVFIRRALAAAGVEAVDVSTEPGAPTGISVILSGPEDRAILTMPGTIPLLTADAVRAAVDRSRPDHVHFASYFLMPRLAAELPELLGWLKSDGITTSLDTNWDPSGQWLGLGAVLGLVDFLFPNLEELRQIAGAQGWEGGSDESAARVLAEFGPRIVVKAGADGGWSLASGGQRMSSPGLALDVVDTTGAGDSFDAGYLAAWCRGVDDEPTRLRWAAVAGSLSTRRAGGTTAQATLTELVEAAGVPS